MTPALAPLSWMQEQIYFLDRLEPHNPVYHSPLGLRLTGPLDEGALERAIGEVIRRHSVLRSRICWRDSEPMLEEIPFEPPQAERVDAPPGVAEDPLAWAVHTATRYTRRPFDLEKGPFYRILLLRLGECDHLLVLVVHHLATDGWSQQILTRELLDAYAAFVAGRQAGLPDLPFQYAEFARLQRSTLAGARLDREVEFWSEKLAGAPPEIALPWDRAVRSSRQSLRVAFTLSPDEAGRLRTMGHSVGATPFMVSAAVLGTLLCRYDGGEIVVVAVPFAGRTRPEHQGIVGCFINTLPLPIDIRSDPTVSELIRNVRASVLEAYEHQEVPLSLIISALGVERSLLHRPFHQVLLNSRNFSSPSHEERAHGLRVQRVRVETRAPAVDLTLGIEPAGQSWRFELEYDTGRFDAETAEEVCEHLHTGLMAMIDDPQARARDLPIMTEQKRRRVLTQWNGTRTAFPRDATVPSVFADVARRDPNALAVTERNRRFRYEDLDRLSDSLAARLAALGAGARCPVGILLPRSTEAIVAMLAALKVGAAYVPLDPTHPQERLARILADAGVGVLVGAPGEDGAPREGELPVVTVEMDSIGEPLRVGEPQSPLDVAYIMYTSGSTGEPKGVAVPHRAILRLVLETDYIRLGPGDVLAHVSNTAFDAATFEVWGALLNGASMLVIDQETVLSPVRFAEVLRTEKVTTLFLTTALFNLISREVPGVFQPLREVLFGGEAADPAAVRAVLAQGPPARLLHVYGPTEVTTFATWHEVVDVPADAITVPIGQPIANTTAHVLDARGRPVPVLVPGELHLGGDGVALGYVGRAEETRQYFLPDPFSSDPGARLYRSGDRVRRRADGAIEFLGRNDRQIKIRGFRIEPGEIESRLLEHASVAACVVDLWESEHADRRLAAWVVPREEQFDASDLNGFLRERLPAYMIPSRFVPLDALPMTANGKVDRRALPDPATARESEIDSAPSTLPEPESTLLEIWREVLDLKKIGVHDDFFDDLGGNSLLAVHLFSLVEQNLGIQMPLEALFRSPTIAQLAAEIGGSWSNDVGALYPLQGRGNAPPLFCVHGAGGHLLMYREFARHLGPDRPVYGFALNRIHPSGELPATVEAMAERYLEELRRFRPEGPYHLSGYSFGGLVAWEMACRLEAAGDEVGLLAMFDATRETPARFPRRERAKRTLVKLRRSIAGNTRRLRAQPLAAWPNIAHEKMTSLRARWRVRTRRGIEVSRHGDLFALCRHAHRLYRARPYGGRLTYYYATQGFDERKSFVWRELAKGGVRLIPIPARHTDLFASQAEVIAARVRESLEEIEAESDGYVGWATDAERTPHFIGDTSTLAAEIPGGNGAAPIGSIESAMASLWEEILEIPSVSRDDRFFDLGGHSLMAVRLVVAVEKKWGFELPISAVFDSPTLSELAQLVSRSIERRT